MQKASVFNPQTCIKWLYSHKLKDIIPLRSKTNISKPCISFTLCCIISWYMHNERLRSGYCWQLRLNKSQQSTRVRLGHYQVGFICCLWQAVKSGPAGPRGELRQGTSTRLPWGSTAAAPVPRADVMPRSGSPCSHWLIASRQRWVIALVLVYQPCRDSRVHLSEKG